MHCAVAHARWLHAGHRLQLNLAYCGAPPRSTTQLYLWPTHPKGRLGRHGALLETNVILYVNSNLKIKKNFLRKPVFIDIYFLSSTVLGIIKRTIILTCTDRLNYCSLRTISISLQYKTLVMLSLLSISILGRISVRMQSEASCLNCGELVE